MRERGVPGVLTCSSGLAGNLDLFCAGRITCSDMRHVEREGPKGFIIVIISFYWGKREIIDLSSCLLTILSVAD